MSRYLPKGIPPEKLRPTRKSSELSAGTGEVQPSAGAQAKEEEKVSEDASSPFKTPSIPDEEEKELPVQKIHMFGIKSATAPASDRKKEESTPKMLIPPDASINFYRLNSMLAKHEDSSAGRTKDLLQGGRKVPRIGNLHSEVEGMKTSLESLFVFTVLFDVFFIFCRNCRMQH